jgi:hypothetical protein
MKKSFVVFLLGLSALALTGLNINADSNEMQSETLSPVFSYSRSLGASDQASDIVSKADIIHVNFDAVKKLISSPPQLINIEIPLAESKTLTLEMKQSFPLSDDFTLYEKNGSFTVKRNYVSEGIHYSGKIAGDDNSIAALSFFRNSVMGVISDERGNFNLGPMSGDNGQPTGEYVLYNDADLLHSSGFKCGVEGMEEKFVLPPGSNVAGSKALNDNPLRLPVKVYFEADFQTYLDNGSNIQNVANFISAFYNSVQVIYQSEGLPTEVSNIAVWTAADPYRNLTQSDTILFAFGNNTKDNFQGNLAHLISTRSAELGGIAWINVLCAQYEPGYFAGRFAFSNIENGYNNFPNYSWTVNVVTHEMGHNLGSRHTHSCTWPVGFGGALGAIDSCYYAEGGCFPAPRPRVGTIMSYCHLWPESQGGGVNLASGFGPLPGDTIRLRYAQASCLDRTMNSSERPAGFDLAQNHPNPFNPSTVISFAVPENSTVTLSVYDINGRKIADLISSKAYEPGFYDVSFNASEHGLSSGIYFYRMQAGGYVETKRMAMVK